MNLKQKMREKIRPKQIGCVDYETLYNAFFTDQDLKKGSLTTFGDLNYDEKEKKYTGKPFHLSSELRNALGLNENDLPQNAISPPP